MAISEQGRTEVMADIGRLFSARSLPCGLTKAQMRASVVAIDDYLDSKAAEINAALPAAARAALDADQKALLVSLVAARRAT